MERTDTNIHHFELLVTLKYLLCHTDEDHPATQAAIVEYGNELGHVFGVHSSNGIRRQRISDCLAFLKEISDQHRQFLPFRVEQKKKGKYYAVSYLDEEHIVKILSAIMNDKYISPDETKDLETRLLNCFFEPAQQKNLLSKANKFDRKVTKYKSHSDAKINLVNRAYNERKLLRIDWDIIDPVSRTVSQTFEIWYRVYKIYEYKGRPSATLLPVDDQNALFNRTIADAIENLKIPLDKKDGVLLKDDPQSNRDLSNLFQKIDGVKLEKGDTAESLLHDGFVPVDTSTCEIYFYFKNVYFNDLNDSFQARFSTNLAKAVNRCPYFERVPDANGIKLRVNDHSEDGEWCVAHFSFNRTAFLSWLRSDLHTYGDVSISSLVTVTYPFSINDELKEYYLHQAYDALGKMPLDDAKKALSRLKNEADQKLNNFENDLLQKARL